MLDAKLVAITAVLSAVVIVGVRYLDNDPHAQDAPLSLAYADDFDAKMGYMCQEFTGDGCAAAVCDLLLADEIDVHTPLRVSCGDYDVDGTLDAMGTTTDWYARATLVSSEEPGHATEEWCEANEATNNKRGVEIVDATMGDCAPFLPIIAAAVNAEYDRYVARAHLAEFGDVLDAFCADTTNPDLQLGCEEARAGFKGPGAGFQVPCANGDVATFIFGDFVLELDAIRARGGGAADVEAYVNGRCGHHDRRLAVGHVPNWHEPALTTARARAGMLAVGGGEHTVFDAPEGRAAKKTAGGLKDLLRQASTPLRGGDEGRKLHFWHHHHHPHHHNPHSYVPGAGCRNKCGNGCFGRCGPGCTQWAACGCDGKHAHNACWQHDTACSCGAWWYGSCLALAGTSVMNAPGWLHGENTGNSGCTGSNWAFHQSVQGWGKTFKGWNDPSVACSKAGDWNYDQLGNWMGLA